MWLYTWSRQVPMKSTNMTSTTGRSPACAIPTAIPTKDCSLIGVSITRFAPKSRCRDRVDPNTPPIFPTSSPKTTMRGSAVIASLKTCAITCDIFMSFSFTIQILHSGLARDQEAVFAALLLARHLFHFQPGFRCSPIPLY